MLAAFFGQFYDNKPPPKLILLSHEPPDCALARGGARTHAGGKVELAVPQRGDKRKLVDHALVNAREALGRRLAESASQQKLLEGVAAALGLEAPPQRIEVYDNSHIQGSHAVGAMIVAGPEGFMKTAYRKFTIRGGRAEGALSAAIDAATEPPPAAVPLTPGDDYGMMREVLSRRFARALKEDPTRERGSWPDLVLIDGGAGQLSSAQQVLADLGIDDIAVVAIAKGPDRNAGRERFFSPGARALQPRRPRIPCSTTCSACATRRTALPSARIARGAPRRSAARRSTRSPASARGARRRCCIISAPRAASRAPDWPISSASRASARRSRKRYMTISMPSPRGARLAAARALLAGPGDPCGPRYPTS